MGLKTKLPDERVKEATPFIVVRLGKLKNNWHMGFDIDGL